MKRWIAGAVVLIVALTAARGLACEMVCPGESTAPAQSCHGTSDETSTATIDATHVCDHTAAAPAVTLVKRLSVEQAPMVTTAAILGPPIPAVVTANVSAAARCCVRPPRSPLSVLRI